jgi:hypothetical protein
LQVLKKSLPLVGFFQRVSMLFQKGNALLFSAVLHLSLSAFRGTVFDLLARGCDDFGVAYGCASYFVNSAFDWM